MTWKFHNSDKQNICLVNMPALDMFPAVCQYFEERNSHQQ